MEIEELASRITRQKPRLTESDLRIFEAMLPTPLPEDFRRFLVLSGGGGELDQSLEFEWATEGPWGGVAGNYWVALFCEPDGRDDYHSIRPLYRHIEDMEYVCANVPRDIYVIADDWSGNFLTIDLRPASHGQIGVVDHETVGARFEDAETYEIAAESFSAFAAGL